MTIHLIIKGNVQGVFFRATAKRIAEKNNLTGWIKNKSSGDVEAMVTGSENDVNAFVEWCHHGPDKARVDDLIITGKEETLFKSFEVKRYQ